MHMHKMVLLLHTGTVLTRFQRLSLPTKGRIKKITTLISSFSFNFNISQHRKLQLYGPGFEPHLPTETAEKVIYTVISQHYINTTLPQGMESSKGFSNYHKSILLV